ncbi:hypothetical protein [uncultured Cohaesibacter sp.]|uniref:hypothetical protein n=1 Tax=uncultured Cohaesibacter sp. TaxID=1002546 RepID=UPI002AAAB43E|nr:hypothetical protein [uncultured Cohaesibacter sp.]
MISTKATGQRLLSLFLSLCTALFIATIALPSFEAHAQTAQAPLDLGTVIQKGTPRQAPVYLKLPETVPIPAANPRKNGDQDATPEAANQQETAADQLDGQTDNQTGTETAETQDGTTLTDTPQSSETAPASIAEALPEEDDTPEIEPGGIARLQLSALLSDDGQILQRGVNWRIFGAEKDEEGQLPMLHNVDGGPLDVDLEPGSYIVYAGYGYANLTKRVILPKAGDYNESFNLHAGAMRLNAVAAGDITLDSAILKFDIYTSEDSDTNSHTLLVKNVKPNHVVKLSQGIYHVVSNYGTANAKVRGDVEITEGKLINVTMIHNAAKVTLRLVSEPGGEALANTIWTVFTPGGDVVKRAIGAFPTLALAAGDYTAIAKQGNEVYNRDFSVTSGLNRDIEVLSTAQ